MSGGHFEHKQNILNQLSEEVREERLKYSKDRTDDEDKWNKLPDMILKEMDSLSKDLERDYKRIHDLDWFLSGDYGEDTYLECIKERNPND